MRHYKTRRHVAAALLLIVLIAGASLAQNAVRRKFPAPKPHALTSGWLVQIRSMGGRTVNGLYQMTTTIRRDGQILFQDNNGQRAARLTPAETARLAACIRQADFRDIRARRHSGPPPSASDGQDITYTFSTPRGPQTVTNTRTNINLQHPLFATLDALLTKYVRP